MADSTVRVLASLTARNTGTDWLQLRTDHSFFDISVSGTFSGSVHLQRKRPGESASVARDIESYAAAAEKLGEMRGHWDVRLFVKSGDYTSGTVEAELAV